MDDATEVTCSGFADAILDHMAGGPPTVPR
jgi:hypothetical protein